MIWIDKAIRDILLLLTIYIVILLDILLYLLSKLSGIKFHSRGEVIVETVIFLLHGINFPLLLVK